MTAMINLILDETQKARLDSQVASGGYPSAEAFVSKVLEEERLRRSGDWLAELTAGKLHTEETRQAVAQRLTALLDEAIASGPAAPMTARDWEDMRREVRERRQ